MFRASYAHRIWGVRTGTLVSSTPIPRPTQDPSKSIPISISLQSLQKIIRGRGWGEQNETNFYLGSATSPRPVVSSKLSTLSFLRCWGVTHIRHDEPLSPAGAISTPEKETPGDSPVRIPSHPDPNKRHESAPLGLGDTEGSRSSRIPMCLSPPHLPNPRDLSPKQRGRGVHSSSSSTPAPPAGPGLHIWQSGPVTRLSGLPGSLRSKVRGCPLPLQGQASKTGSSESRRHMTCDLLCAPGSTPYASGARGHGISGEGQRTPCARAGVAPRPHTSGPPRAAASCACADAGPRGRWETRGPGLNRNAACFVIVSLAETFVLCGVCMLFIRCSGSGIIKPYLLLNKFAGVNSKHQAAC